MTSNVEQAYQKRILDVLIHIQNHLDDELTLEELAEIAHFSPYHFHRIFSAHTGESVQSYVRRLRLERATRDLAYTDLSIINIAQRAGYDTQQSFHRAFKETYHETPKAFRDKAIEGIAQFSKANSEEAKTQLVDVKTIEPITVAFVRHVGPYADIMKTWLHLVLELGMAHVTSEKTMRISIPYDSNEITPSDKLRYDACVTLNELPNFKPKGQIGVQTIRCGKYAVITHYGPLEMIEATYRILFGIWLPQSGYEPADHPNFILHRKTPFATPAESLETDIYLPLK